MLKDLLKEVITIVAGKQVENIADLLYSKKHVNEFIIAKKLDITINQTRNILYKISDHGLVSSIRKKDKRKGWYTYFWKIEVLKSLEFLKTILVKNIEQLEHQIHSRETKMFYTCENCKIEFNEENALIRDFTCNECGRIFTQKDNAKFLRELKRNLDKLQKELIVTNEEIEKEEKIREKIKEKGIALLKKERQVKRKKTMKDNADKKEALRKKEGKAPLKKKPVKKKVVKKKIAKKKPVKKKANTLNTLKGVKGTRKKPVKKKDVKKKPIVKPIKKKIIKNIFKKTKKGKK